MRGPYGAKCDEIKWINIDYLWKSTYSWKECAPLPPQNPRPFQAMQSPWTPSNFYNSNRRWADLLLDHMDSLSYLSWRIQVCLAAYRTMLQLAFTIWPSIMVWRMSRYMKAHFTVMFPTERSTYWMSPGGTRTDSNGFSENYTVDINS